MTVRQPGIRGGSLAHGRPAPSTRQKRPPAEAAISATLTQKPTDAELADLAGVARDLEVHADLAGDLDPNALREHFDGRLVYALRSVERGGECDDSAAAR